GQLIFPIIVDEAGLGVAANVTPKEKLADYSLAALLTHIQGESSRQLMRREEYMHGPESYSNSRIYDLLGGLRIERPGRSLGEFYPGHPRFIDGESFLPTTSYENAAFPIRIASMGSINKMPLEVELVEDIFTTLNRVKEIAEQHYEGFFSIGYALILPKTGEEIWESYFAKQERPSIEELYTYPKGDFLKEITEGFENAENDLPKVPQRTAGHPLTCSNPYTIVPVIIPNNADEFFADKAAAMPGKKEKGGK
ncbi:MAG: hypothetical protein HGA85_09360, partial [Nanoarchaeota archaeon]|nr:hypothetical protein [Nanoarchaeota archaeon]